MANKLRNICRAGSILVCDRYFGRLTDERVLISCGCDGSGGHNEKVDLWTRHEIGDDFPFDFPFYHEPKSKWCEIHGEEYGDAIVALDGACGEV